MRARVWAFPPGDRCHVPFIVIRRGVGPGTSLIPGTVANKDGSYSYPDGVLKDAANVLGGNPYMGTCLPCGPNDGTYVEDFILGKYDYLEKFAPGKTIYHAQMNIGWRENPDGGTHPGTKKPGYVQDDTKPTLAFLTGELRKKQDIELFLSEGKEVAHYITFTGIKYDDVKFTGTISFIDAWGGKPGGRRLLSGGWLYQDQLHPRLRGQDVHRLHHFGHRRVAHTGAVGLGDAGRRNDFARGDSRAPAGMRLTDHIGFPISDIT